MSTKMMNRRAILQNWMALTAASVPLGMLASEGAAKPTELQATPACGADDAPTRPGSEGPYYSPRPPAKSDFRADASGEPVTLHGFVRTRDCQPIVGASVDLWHADAQGEYDNSGYRLRGYQLTDSLGRYVFQTIIPAPYDWRTRHFHVKVQPPGGRLLTTQLYFPDEPRNTADFLFHPRLLMDVRGAVDGKVARFDFVLA